MNDNWLHNIINIIINITITANMNNHTDETSNDETNACVFISSLVCTPNTDGMLCLSSPMEISD